MKCLKEFSVDHPSFWFQALFSNLKKNLINFCCEKDVTEMDRREHFARAARSVGVFTEPWNAPRAFSFCRFKALFPVSWAFTPRLAPARMVSRAFFFPIRDLRAIISACFRWASESSPVVRSSSSLSPAPIPQNIDFVPLPPSRTRVFSTFCCPYVVFLIRESFVP